MNHQTYTDCVSDIKHECCSTPAQISKLVLFHVQLYVEFKILTKSLLNTSTNFLSMRYTCISYQSNISLSNFPNRSFYWLIHLPETRCFSDSITLMTGLLWTVKVWNNWGPLPTVSGCWTMTLTVPELVPYAISIQLPLMPAYKRKQINF